MVMKQQSIEAKNCSKCGELKPLTEYTKHQTGKDGLYSQCKPCFAAYAREHYEKNKERRIKQVDQYRKANWEKYKQQIYERERKSPEKRKARHAVNNAVASGKIERPYLCEAPKCIELKLDFHHTKGYEKENWFTGVWLCRVHHSELHKNQREMTRAGLEGGSDE
jgi:hypothetical protein